VSIVGASLRWLRRNAAAGELSAPLVAILVATASVSAIGFFTDRTRFAITTQASELLAADLVLVSSIPVSDRFATAAEARGLETVRAISFRSAVLAGNELQLAEVKAVEQAYPLRGVLRVAEVPYGESRIAPAGPERGTVWVDSRLASRLGVGVGESVEVGASVLRIAAILTEEPDRGADLFSIAPRLLMRIEDVPATNLVQPASRVTHRLMFAGEGAKQFRTWLLPQLGRGERLHSVKDARPELRRALERGERFLQLASLTAVLLASIAVAVSARRFAKRHLDSVAIMRCLGARQCTVVAVFALQLLWLSLFAGIVGCGLGFLAQELLVRLLAGLVPADLPAPGLAPATLGLAVGLVMMVGFALPPVLALRGVSPLRVLRRDLNPSVQQWLEYAGALLAVVGLVLWHANDLELAAYVIAGSVASLLVFGAVAATMLGLLGRVRDRAGFALRQGINSIRRRPLGSVVQVVAFALGVMALLLLTFVRNDLLSRWHAQLPADRPNFFVINIQPDQVKEVRGFFEQRGLSEPSLHPMVRGRLVAINDRVVSRADYEDPRAKRLVDRDFNLSWSSELPQDNRIVAGRWWSLEEGESGGFSVEQGLAKTLGIGLGDELRFELAGRRADGIVRSLRSVEWDSFRVNFFVIADSGSLDVYPATYITSFFLPVDRWALLVDLVRSFPSVSVLDVDALMVKVRGIIERVSMALEYVFAFTLVAGLVVVYAVTQDTQDERVHEATILRFLGAGRRLLLQRVGSEFLVLGSVAGVLAALVATTLTYLLSEHLLGMEFRFDPWLWLAGTGAGVLGVGVAGVLGARKVVTQSVMETLRRL
jgi:putative ABC transport system permease protein